MEDEQILNLYFSRSEQAIGETASKYGPYCHSIAMHVLENEEDAEKTGEGRRKREKRFELQRIFGTDQYDAGGHRQVCPDGRGTR